MFNIDFKIGDVFYNVNKRQNEYCLHVLETTKYYKPGEKDTYYIKCERNNKITYVAADILLSDAYKLLIRYNCS